MAQLKRKQVAEKKARERLATGKKDSKARKAEMEKEQATREAKAAEEMAEFRNDLAIAKMKIKPQKDHSSRKIK